MLNFNKYETANLYLHIFTLNIRKEYLYLLSTEYIYLDIVYIENLWLL